MPVEDWRFISCHVIAHDAAQLGQAPYLNPPQRSSNLSVTRSVLREEAINLQMETLIVYNKFPYTNADLMDISKSLHEINPIVTPWIDFDKYDFLSYAEQRDVHNCQFRAVFDLNLISNAIRLCERKALSESMRHTAGLLAFLIVTDTLFDVGPATAELLHKRGGGPANKNLRLFRLADNVNPGAYADIALGRRDRLSKSEVPKLRASPKRFAPEIHYNWHLHYIALLKLALISRNRGSGQSKLMKYLEWMWRDYMFCSTAFAFAAIYLSPNPYGQMMKGTGSHDSERVLAGIRNATWDLVLAHYWAARVRENFNTGKLWIFCSLDKALREIASNLLIDSESDEAVKRKLNAFLSDYWPAATVPVIMAACDSYMQKRNDANRAFRRIKSQKEFLPFADALEKELVAAARTPE